MLRHIRRFMLLLLLGAWVSGANAQDVTGAWVWYANGFKGELYLKQTGNQIHGWIGLNGENLINDTVDGSLNGIEVRFSRTNTQLGQPQQYHGFILRANNPGIDPKVRMTGGDAMAGTFSHYGQWAAAWYAVRTGPYREQTIAPVAGTGVGPVPNPTGSTPIATGGSGSGNGAARPALAGGWTSGGRPTSITQDGSGNLVLTNEYGQQSRGRFADATTVIATDWEGGLRGMLTDGNRMIRWANGTAWARPAASAIGVNPVPAPVVMPALGGGWTSGGWPTSITQDGSGNLVFTNEYGQQSRGRFADATTVIATDWEGGLRGALTDGNRMIRWANGTAWSR